MMNSADLAGFVPTIEANSSQISDNMTSLAAISPNAMANADAVGVVANEVLNNEALVAGLDGIISNNANLIGPLLARANANSD